jgi:hypothetical protein
MFNAVVKVLSLCCCTVVTLLLPLGGSHFITCDRDGVGGRCGRLVKYGQLHTYIRTHTHTHTHTGLLSAVRNTRSTPHEHHESTIVYGLTCVC